MRTVSALFLLVGGAASALLAPGVARAQTNVAGVRIGGLGRAVVTTDALTGDALDGDTTNARRAAGGYTFVDLAVEAKPNTATTARVVMRLQTDLGGFFGDGYRFGIRELWLGGTIANAVAYRLGDFDLRLTPYTAHATSESAVNEASLFAERRDVVRYEHYDYGDQTWRLQGAHARTGLAFARGIERLRLDGFIARNAPTTGSVPDRLLGGGRVAADVTTGLTAGATYVNLFDLAPTGNAPALVNPVVSADVQLERPAGAATLGLRMEAGTSLARYDRTGAVRRTDYFYDVAATAKVRRLHVSAGYRDVGPQFFSPAAQSRRLAYDQRPALFAAARGLPDGRTLALTDPLQQPSLYTTRIDPRLAAFDPRLDAAEPYGRATPNRRGVTLDARVDGSNVNATARVDLLNEIVGEGTPQTRTFTVAEATADLPLTVVPGTLSLGVRHTRVDRDASSFSVTLPSGQTAAVDTGAVALRGTLVNAGLTVPLVRKVEAMAGVKYLAGEGTEFRALRDDPNDAFRITGFTPLRFDGGEWVAGAGLRYRVRDGHALSAQASWLRSDADAARYGLAHVFLHYVLSF